MPLDPIGDKGVTNSVVSLIFKHIDHGGFREVLGCSFNCLQSIPMTAFRYVHLAATGMFRLSKSKVSKTALLHQLQVNANAN